MRPKHLTSNIVYLVKTNILNSINFRKAVSDYLREEIVILAEAAYIRKEKWALKYQELVWTLDGINHLIFTESLLHLFSTRGYAKKKKKNYLFLQRSRVRDCSSTGSLPKCMQQLGLGQAESRNLELYPALPCGPKNLSHYLLPPRSRGARTWTRHSIWDVGFQAGAKQASLQRPPPEDTLTWSYVFILQLPTTTGLHRIIKPCKLLTWSVRRALSLMGVIVLCQMHKREKGESKRHRQPKVLDIAVLRFGCGLSPQGLCAESSIPRGLMLRCWNL